MAHNPYFSSAYEVGVKDRRAGKARINPFITKDRDGGTSSRDGWYAGWDDEDRSLRTGEEHVCNCGAQDRAEHRPHSSSCSINR